MPQVGNIRLAPLVRAHGERRPPPRRCPHARRGPEKLSPVRVFHRTAIWTLVAEQVTARASIDGVSTTVVTAAIIARCIGGPAVVRSISSRTDTVRISIDARTLSHAC
jgi:hypothetical protein